MSLGTERENVEIEQEMKDMSEPRNEAETIGESEA